MLEARGTQIGYASHTVLSNVAFAADEGEIVGLLGASGSGKSTLLRCLSGLLPPQAGVVTLGNRMLWPRRSGDPSIWPTVSFVFQRNLLFQNLTLRENCLLGFAQPALVKVEQRTMQLFRSLEISNLADRKPQAVSEGQRTRTSIIRSLIRCPKLLLMDEPTAPLDANMKNRLTIVLKDYQRYTQSVIVIASHDLEFLRRTADHFLVVKNGAVMMRSDFESALKAFSGPTAG